MGNCVFRNDCICTFEQHMLACGNNLLARAPRDCELRSLVSNAEDTRPNFIRPVEFVEGVSWKSHISGPDCNVDQGLIEVREKIDGLIGADLFAFRGMVGLPFREADAVCECQKHFIKKGSEYYRVSGSSNKEQTGASQYLKASETISDLQVYIVTWNMNGKVSSDDLPKLIHIGKEMYDFYVIGLQEVPNCNVETVILDKLGNAYSLVAAVMLMSLQLYIFGRKTFNAHVDVKRVDKMGLGGLGAVVRRQKGAVAVLLKFKEVSFLFIACHLSPHKSNVEERNSQYQRISQSLFSKPTTQLCTCLKSASEVVDNGDCCGVKALDNSFLEQSDVVVWLGDLNYRVEGNRSSVDFLLAQNLYKSLWCRDQLSREIQRGHVFNGYCEGPLSFPPTYKYDIGTDNYDTSAKERVPSWTDRILYKVKDASSIKAYMHGYGSVDGVKSSDHRPVKALLKLNGISTM